MTQATRALRLREVCFLRIAAVYVLLNAVLYALFIVPFGRSFRELYIDLLLPVAGLFGKVLGLEVLRPPRGTGSGDTSFDWAYMALALVLSTAATGIWSCARTHGSVRSLRLWLHTVLRYALAGNMFAYGLIKLTLYQFPPPGPEQLMLRFGDSSPVTLLWIFMGSSPAYGRFTGLIEVAAGVLLLFRRTTTVAALIAFAGLSHILALNLAYDVPVRLFAAHLWASSVFLIWADRNRLWDLFVLNRPAAPADLSGPPLLDRLGRSRPVIKIAIVGLLLAPSIRQQGLHLRNDRTPPPALRGAYEVRTVDAGSPRETQVFDVTFDGQIMTLWNRRGRQESYHFTAADGVMHLSRDGSDERSTLSYAHPSPGTIMIEGEVGGRQVRWNLDERPSFGLLAHGFHWVIERPHWR